MADPTRFFGEVFDSPDKDKARSAPVLPQSLSSPQPRPMERLVPPPPPPPFSTPVRPIPNIPSAPFHAATPPSMPAEPAVPKPTEKSPGLPLQGGTTLRTMKSDMAHFFKNTTPSVPQMVNITPASFAVKKPRRILIFFALIGAVIFLGSIAAGGAYYFRSQIVNKVSPRAGIPTPTPPKLVPPTPFFSTETSRTISVAPDDRAGFLQLMQGTMKETEREGTIKRLIIKIQDKPQERFAEMKDFLSFYRIAPPSSFLKRTDPGFMPFVYTDSQGTRFGMSLHTRDPNHTLRDLLDWEPAMTRDFIPLLFSQTTTPASNTAFEDRTYRNIDWRYLKFSTDQDLGIGYTIFPANNVLVITTSKALMETVINRLFEAR